MLFMRSGRRCRHPPSPTKEIKYSEPAGVKVGANQPSALMAMNRAIEMISNLKTPYDLDKKAERTTYTVGVGSCTPAPEGERSKECTLLVDMRSPTPGPLKDIRSKIEPAFAKALQQENAKYGLKDGDAKAVKMELVWFGDRPAHKRKNYDDPAMQAFWQSARTAGIDIREKLNERAASLNDNVPAAVGVPIQCKSIQNQNFHKSIPPPPYHRFAFILSQLTILHKCQAVKSCAKFLFGLA